MRTIKDMTIETRKVVLDGTEFIRCGIRYCEIHYSGGKHSLIDTKIEGVPGFSAMLPSGQLTSSMGSVYPD